MRLSAGAIALVVVVVGAIAAAAMFFSDDDLIHRWLGEDPGASHPAEIRARWLGMSVVSPASKTAQRWRITPNTEGVVVAELLGRQAWRPRRAGVNPGDLVVGLDGTQVQDMTDFVDATHQLDVRQAMLIDVARAGQIMTLVLPSVDGGTAGLQPQAGGQGVGSGQGGGQGVGSGQGGGWGQGAGRGQGGGWSQGAGRGQGGGWSQGAGPAQRGWRHQPLAGRGAPPAAANSSPLPRPLNWGPGGGGRGGLFTCPIHRVAFNGAAVHPRYRCPQCNAPLQQVP